MKKNKVICGDSKDILKEFPDSSVDLYITSPPYAERRKNCYDSIHEDKYVEWFSPFAKEIKRTLKPTGSFFLNIKPHTNKGERSLYVFDLVQHLKRDLGFLFVDEFCWIKNPFPGNYNGRFKNGFEPVYHFTKSQPSKIKHNPLACGTPIKEESIKRANRKQCGAPKNNSGMWGMRTNNIKNLKLSRPSNVVVAHNVSNQFNLKQHHPATFPEKLVEFFIKSFTNENDVVVDPFAGSGTIGVVCKNLNRDYILIDNKKDYCELSERRINEKK